MVDLIIYIQLDDIIYLLVCRFDMSYDLGSRFFPMPGWSPSSVHCIDRASKERVHNLIIEKLLQDDILIARKKSAGSKQSGESICIYSHNPQKKIYISLSRTTSSQISTFSQVYRLIISTKETSNIYLINLDCKQQQQKDYLHDAHPLSTILYTVLINASPHSDFSKWRRSAGVCATDPTMTTPQGSQLQPCFRLSALD